MNKLFSSLVCLAVLVRGAPAHAIPTGVLYDAFMDGVSVGTLVFELDSEIPLVACRYSVDWMAPGNFLSAQCYLDEMMTVGRAICAADASEPMTGLLQLAPSDVCDGFDGNAQETSFFLMALGEHADDGSLDGLVQISAAEPDVDAFSAQRAE